MTDAPWEPALAGTELDHLTGALDRLRATFRWKVDDLDAAGLAAPIRPLGWGRPDFSAGRTAATLCGRFVVGG